MSDDDPVTFRQVQEERNIEEHAEEHAEGQPAQETPVPFLGPDLEEQAAAIRTILEPTPETVQEEAEEAVREVIRRNIVRRRSDSVDETISEFSTELLEVDLSELSERGLLEHIARILQLMFELHGTIAGIAVNQLDALFNILTSVEPFSRITVSGVHVVEAGDEDTVLPVVPESDTVDIPTRILFIRASPNNSDQIAFGDDEVEPDDGFILNPGEHQVLSINLAQETLWMSAETGGDEVQLMGLT